MTRNKKKNGSPKKIWFNPKGSPINGGFFLAPGENPSIQGPRRQWNFTREDWNFVIRHWGKSENGVPGIPPIPLSGPSLSIMPLTYHGCLESMDVWNPWMFQYVSFQQSFFHGFSRRNSHWKKSQL
jgi:hypothetical protein